MVKKKVSLGSSPDVGEAAAHEGTRAPALDILELFFNTGIVFHEVPLPRGLPDVVSSFVLMKPPGTAPAAPRPGAQTKPQAPGVLGAPPAPPPPPAPAMPAGIPPTLSVRRAGPGEEPDVEISAVDHLSELSNRWFPVPYQLSCPFAVQVFLGNTGGGLRAVLAIDTLEQHGSQGRHLDASFDEGRPFRPLDKNELGSFFDHPDTRELVRRLERGGVDKALFKLAALLEALGPQLPKLRFSRVESHQPIPVSLVLDLGNSRTTALLVEGRDARVFGVPLEVRNLGNPLETRADAIDSRLTFLPGPWDKATSPVAVGDSFQWPSVARMGLEALDRALETPHRYQCTLSGPKRYLWDDRQTDERWHFAQKIGSVGAPGDGSGEYRPVFGRILKYVPEDSGGIYLREDGPQTPADPRYAPRAMMLFAIVEILCQAYAQINGAVYRTFQGKEASPRVLRHLVLTYPSAMREEERRIYEALVRNAVILACHVLGIRPDLRPNWDAQAGSFEPFLLADEALAAQMVFVYEEVQGTFSGSMEELVSVYGHEGGSGQKTLRVASIDIGGGTSDVMIAEYEDKMPGTGTALSIRKLFQDGVSIAGDEVCRAIVEDVVFSQILQQLPTAQDKSRLRHLFGEGDAGHGSTWRTLRARLVPYFWMPLARCFWAVAEGFAIPDHTDGKLYTVPDLQRVFSLPTVSPVVLLEADRFLGEQVPGFPGIENLLFKLDGLEVERAIERVLREPLRRYADILAQFDVDLLVLAGRTASLPCVRAIFTKEMPVPPPRIKPMARYRVGEWYPSKWKDEGYIRDAKSTVTAGAAVLHLASKNRLPGFLVDSIGEVDQRPIYGLYQDTEPHIARANELFPANAASPRETATSAPFVYTHGLRIGFRNVDSQEMEGSPLFEVRPANRDVEQALLDDRVALQFGRTREGHITVAKVTSQRGQYSFEPTDFVLALKTATYDRYWLDTGVFDVERGGT